MNITFTVNIELIFCSAFSFLFFKIASYFGWHLLLETAVAACLMLLWCYSQFMHRISSEHLQKAPFKKRRPESLLQHSQLPTLPFYFAILKHTCLYHVFIYQNFCWFKNVQLRFLKNRPKPSNFLKSSFLCVSFFFVVV